MKPRAEIHTVEKPCTPGYEGWTCVRHYWRAPCGTTGLSFWYYETRGEALDAWPEAITGRA